MSQSGFGLLLFKACAGFIAPATLRHETVEEADVLLIGLSAMLKAPREDFFVAATLQRACGQVFEADSQQRADTVVKGVLPGMKPR